MIAIINYGVGNLSSILNMFNRLSIDAIITDKTSDIKVADKLLIPGVGHFDSCMKNFNASGLRHLVEQRIFTDKINTLGICVGAQMMTRGSEEGMEKGLGWIDAETIKFTSSKENDIKIPHMGWADLKVVQNSPLWNDVPNQPRFYFAHSYHFNFESDSHVIGKCFYGYEYASAFSNDHIYGLQFHPEKSHKYGMKVLANFAAL